MASAMDIGKGLPNLKITVGNDAKPEKEDSSEEGEIADDDNHSDNEPKIEVQRQFVSPLERSRVYENKGGAFITGLDLSSEAVTKKLADRATRFGLEEHAKRAVTHDEIKSLYKSLEIATDDAKLFSCKSKNIRLDVLHMRGVEDMSTSDVIDYFKEYGPASVEWINDCSCNVVWLDNEGAARALLGLSRVLVVKKKSENPENKQNKFMKDENEKDNNKSQLLPAADKEEVIFMSDLSSDSEEEDDEENLGGFKRKGKGNPQTESVTPMEIDGNENDCTSNEKSVECNVNVDVPVPPGQWRLGVPHKKAKAILLRFAMKDDRKLPGAEKRSHYYQKYGNPNYGGLKGLISKTRKRKFNATKQRQVVEQLSTKGNSVNFGTAGQTKGGMLNLGKDGVRRQKPLRMRMYADDEEERLKLRAAKRQRIVESSSKRSSIHDRLGRSYYDQELLDTGRSIQSHLSEEDEEEEFGIKSTVSRPGSSNSREKDRFSRFDVWTRLAETMAQESEVEEINYRPNHGRSQITDLRSKLHSSKPSYNVRAEAPENNYTDLRSKLERLRKHDKVKSHRSPLLIEIDNSSTR